MKRSILFILLIVISLGHAFGQYQEIQNGETGLVVRTKLNTQFEQLFDNITTVQFSADGVSNWHSTYAASDNYMRFSRNLGQTWGQAIEITSGFLVSFSTGDGSWSYDLPANAAYYRFSTDGGATWSDSIQIAAGTDANAIHDNEAGEITALSEKTNPVNDDVLIIEDSGDSNNKKKVKISNLPTGVASSAEKFTVSVRKASTGFIEPGVPVYLVDDTLNYYRVEAADATTMAKLPAIGASADTITDDESVELVLSGELVNVNTSAFTVADEVYVADTSGLTATKPTGTSHVQKFGQVAKVGTTDGVILISGWGVYNDLPNLPEDYIWKGNSDGVPEQSELTIEYDNLESDLTGNTTNNTLTWDVDGSGIVTCTRSSSGTVSFTNPKVNKYFCVVLTLSSGATLTWPSSAKILDGSATLEDGTFYIYIHCISSSVYTVSITKEE